MKKAFIALYPILTGAVGFALRRNQLASLFEVESGLPISMTAGTVILTVYLLLAIAAGIVIAMKLPRVDGPYTAAFKGAGDTLYMSLVLVAAALMAVGGAMAFQYAGVYGEEMAREASNLGANFSNMSTVPNYILAAMCILSGVATFFVGKNGYKGGGKGDKYGLLLFPPFTSCVWLIVTYQHHSAQPFLQAYMWQMLAVIMIVIAQYLVASYSFTKGRFVATVAFSLAAAVLGGVALADSLPTAYYFIYTSMILYILSSLVALCGGDAKGEEKTNEPE